MFSEAVSISELITIEMRGLSWAVNVEGRVHGLFQCTNPEDYEADANTACTEIGTPKCVRFFTFLEDWMGQMSALRLSTPPFY